MKDSIGIPPPEIIELLSQSTISKKASEVHAPPPNINGRPSTQLLEQSSPTGGYKHDPSKSVAFELKLQAKSSVQPNTSFSLHIPSPSVSLFIAKSPEAVRQSLH